MRKILFCTLIFLFMPQLFGQHKSMNVGEINTKNYFESIKIGWVKSKIIVPIKIKGKTYRFILDTGAPNIISTKLYEDIKAETIDNILVRDAFGKEDSLRIALVGKLEIGNLSFENTASLVFDLEANKIFNCAKIDGFIGSNMLRNSIVQIDVPNKTLILTDNKKKLHLNKKNSLKMELLGMQSNPYVWIKLNGKKTGKEQVLVDTGMDGFYDLSLKHFEIFRQDEIFGILNRGEGSSSVGIFGDVPVSEHYRVLTPSIGIAGVLFKNVVTVTTDDDNSRIGSEILKYGVVTIDYKNKRFYYNTSEQEYNLLEKISGFSYTMKNDKLVVGFVWDESLKNKIAYGDEIVEINGKGIDEFDFCDLILEEPYKEKGCLVKIKKHDGRQIILNYKKKIQEMSE